MSMKLIATTDLSTLYTPGRALGNNATFSDLINPLLLNAIYIGGVVAFVFLIFAGFNYISAAGDKNKIAQATNMLNYVLLGLVLIVSAFLITLIIGKVLGFNFLGQQ